MLEMATDKETFLVPAPPPPPPLLKARPEAEGPSTAEGPRNGFQAPPRAPSGGGGNNNNKRRNSCHVGGFKPPAFKRRRRVNSECDPVLPSEFLLGGNIFDPLNLNSLLDDEVNRALNAETPKSSPLPAKGRDPVEILIPKDITDPLSLNAAQEDPPVLASPLKTGRKRHRHRGNQRAGTTAAAAAVGMVAVAPEGALPAVPAVPPPPSSSSSSSSSCRSCHKACNGATPQPYELNTAINCRDEVVSPLLAEGGEPAASGNAAPACSSSAAASYSVSRHHHHHHHHHRKRRRTLSKSESRGTVAAGEQQQQQPGRSSPERELSGRQLQGLAVAAAAPRRPPRHKFQYGNYCKYYGYRNPDCEDVRLRAMKPEWFRGREVLDVGCNVGHLTLSVAKKWEPARMVGLDIDGALIHSARQNIRHYLSEEMQEEQQQQRDGRRGDREEGPTPPAKKTFPASLMASRGPIAAPRVPQDGVDATVFPNNIIFVKGNYILERDELLEAQKPEYDVILCLSVTKWVQLNWGDEGVKRLFKRAYRHLRPGGLFVLEPQAWSSYKKRKNLTETISRHYHWIKLKPEQFPSYLISSEVGFASYELVAMPRNTPKGFQRPIYLFRKGHPGTTH